MSTPSSFPRRPSSVTVPRQQSNNLMCRDNLSRPLSNILNEGYHGGEAVSVPFTWESQPGTPKLKFRETSLPPLTPPPSYYSTANNRQKSKEKKTSPKPNLLKAIFPKRTTTKGRVPSLPASPSSSYSSSSSSSSSSNSSSSGQKSYSVPSSPMVYSGKNEQDDDLYHVPASSLCFGNARSRGYYSSMVKKLLLGDFL